MTTTTSSADRAAAYEHGKRAFSKIAAVLANFDALRRETSSLEAAKTIVGETAVMLAVLAKLDRDNDAPDAPPNQLVAAAHALAELYTTSLLAVERDIEERGKDGKVVSEEAPS